MAQMSIGDLASTFWSQMHNRRIKSNLQSLSLELATGKTANLHAATGGDLRSLSSLENALSALSAYKTANVEAAHFVETAQRSLASIQGSTSQIGGTLLLAASADNSSIIQTATSDARSHFDMVVSTLNTETGNRGLFSGTGTSGNALISSEDILTELTTAVASETTAAGVEAVVDAWFNDSGGGFETVAYLGSDSNLAPFKVGPNESVKIDLRADSQSIRDLLKGFALASLVAEGVLSGNADQRAELTNTAANQFLSSETALTEQRAKIGSAEALIESARARNNSETAALELARSEIISVDPYETATELQDAQTQMEILYTMTARLSRLSLVNYI